MLVLALGSASSWGASENFSNLPTASPGNYLSRSWTGTDGVTWTATLARTDQTINGKAITFDNSGTRSVSSPTYGGGMGILTFNYVRSFTGTGARTLQVYVNGVKIGTDITVSPTSDTVVGYSANVNVSGNVALEIRSTGAAQVKVDDIAWNTYSAPVAPTVTSSAATSIGAASATLNGNVTADGGASVTDRGFVYNTSSGVTISNNKTVAAEGATGTGAITLGLSSLSVNAQHYFKAYAINSVNTTLSAEQSFWTLANTPAAPTVDGATTSSLNVAINANGNPAGTTFAIRETSLNKFVQANGSLDTTAVFQTASTWGTTTVTGLAPNTAYIFVVKAKNGADIETAFGPAGGDTTLSSGCTPPTIDSTTPVNLTCNGSANGSITVSASGGSGVEALEYSTNNGTDWQSGNQFTGLSAGTYQLRVKRSDGCVSPATPVTLTEPAAVTITLGASPSVCFGTTSASLAYSATTGTPDQYSIDFDATAEGQGFADVTDVSLAASPISITVPGAAAAGTYNVVLTVKNASGCTSGGYAITVTISPASVGGSISPAATAFCGSGSVTLTLSGHTGNVTKWQYSSSSDFSSDVNDVANTTTSLTTPTLNATRYYRAVVLSGVCSAANSALAALTVNPTPTITLGANPTVCSDSTAAALTYSATTGSPDQYSIDFNGAANTAGFTDVSLAALPASPLIITVPGGVAAGTYTGTLTVKNSTTGCTSTGYTISVTVNTFGILGAVTTIAAQGFETTGETWTYSGVTPSANTGASDSPPSQRILAGSSSWQVINTSASATFSTVTTAGYRNLVVKARVSSPSGNGSNGSDTGDHVKVFVALNGSAFSGTADIDLNGNGNSRWGFDATLIAATTAGTPIIIQAPQIATSANNYSTLQVTVPDGTTSVSLKIEANNNDGNEIWSFDSITLTGAPLVATASITAGGPTTFCQGGSVLLTATAGGAHYLWLKDGSPVGTDSASYIATASGNYTVMITGANGCTATSPATTVTVNALPTANNASYNCGPGLSVAIRALDHASDPENASLTVAIGTPPANGSASVVTIGGESYLYYVNTSTAASDTFTYTVTDGQCAAPSAGTVSITLSSPTGTSANTLSPPADIGGGQKRIKFLGIPGKSYQLESKVMLADPAWTPVGSPVQANGTGLVQFDFTPVGGAAFFRTRWVP